MTIAMKTMASPLGEIRLYTRGDALCGVYLPDQGAPLAEVRPLPVLELAAAQLAEYFAGVRTAFELPLAPHGSAFAERVWRQLLAIPYGETRSYGELARALGRPSASRAVGTANANNPLSIVVPCHRVIAANGALTGYAGGLAAKRWLLDHEKRHANGSTARGTGASGLGPRASGEIEAVTRSATSPRLAGPGSRKRSQEGASPEARGPRPEAPGCRMSRDPHDIR